jgi:hypothetical protein
MDFEVHLQLKNESGNVKLVDNKIVVEMLMQLLCFIRSYQL